MGRNRGESEKHMLLKNKVYGRCAYINALLTRFRFSAWLWGERRFATRRRSPAATASGIPAAAPGHRRSRGGSWTDTRRRGRRCTLQGAGDRGRRNAQVGGGLPWRDAGRQCSGQWFRSRRQQLVPGRLSRGRLAQPATKLAPVRLAATAGKPDCFVLQRVVPLEPGNAQVFCHLARRDASGQRAGHQFQRRRCSSPCWCDFAGMPSALELAPTPTAFPSGVAASSILGTPSCFPPPLPAGRGTRVGISDLATRCWHWRRF